MSIPTHARRVWQGTVFSAWQWEQVLYDGTTTTFEAMSRADTAHTVGVLPDGRILLTEDEQPNRSAVITPAGGVIERHESPAEAAQREFLEETGYRIGTLIAWHQYQPSHKIDWTVHAFIGRDLTYETNPQPEAGEKIRLLVYTFEEFLALGFERRLRDLVIRIILLEALLNGQKKAALSKLLYGRR
ncbi:MAG: NUDIX hydrolase [Candidatus Andersenbacteria bacterium]|nr:NUDIX hydrolase [Candidatus Andersenbacteria bacterium]